MSTHTIAMRKYGLTGMAGAVAAASALALAVPAEASPSAPVTATTATRQGPPPPRDRVLGHARIELRAGVKESPLGSNCVKYNVIMFGSNRRCMEWCASFVSYVFYQANEERAIGRRTPSVDVLTAWFRRNGRYGRNKLTLGGVIFYDFNGHSGPDHVGIVTGYNSKYVWATEGNYDNRVKVRRTKRGDSRVTFGAPAWY